MSDKSNKPARPLIGFVTRDDAPPIRPAPISRTRMAEMRAVEVLIQRGESRSLYLPVCRILIQMAEPPFSSSWRILEPPGGTSRRRPT